MSLPQAQRDEFTLSSHVWPLSSPRPSAASLSLGEGQPNPRARETPQCFLRNRKAVLCG